MKVISLWQPWASLIMLGLKRFETRSWATKHRGPLLIHASKKIVPWNELFQELSHADRCKIWIVINQAYGSYENMPTGAILGAVDVRQMYRTEQIKPQLSALEIACGDYSDNRFAWELKNTKPFDKPILAKGKQGLWNWEAEA